MDDAPRGFGRLGGSSGLAAGPSPSTRPVAAVADSPGVVPVPGWGMRGGVRLGSMSHSAENDAPPGECLWANQICEQPNYHGCLTCAAETYAPREHEPSLRVPWWRRLLTRVIPPGKP